MDITTRTAAVYARPRLGLKEKGRPIPENDLWIAALSMEHHVPLIIRDGRFDSVDDLARESL